MRERVPTAHVRAAVASKLDAVGRALNATVRRLGPHPAPWQLATVITAAGIFSPHPTLRWRNAS